MTINWSDKVLEVMQDWNLTEIQHLQDVYWKRKFNDSFEQEFQKEMTDRMQAEIEQARKEGYDDGYSSGCADGRYRDY